MVPGLGQCRPRRTERDYGGPGPDRGSDPAWTIMYARPLLLIRSVCLLSRSKKSERLPSRRAMKITVVCWQMPADLEIRQEELTETLHDDRQVLEESMEFITYIPLRHIHVCHRTVTSYCRHAATEYIYLVPPFSTLEHFGLQIERTSCNTRYR